MIDPGPITHHSPLPWYSGHQYLFAKGGKVLPVASGYHDWATEPQGHLHEEAVANAAFIVRCVNSHEALVEALLDAGAVIDGELGDRYGALVSRIRAALSAAGEAEDSRSNVSVEVNQ